MTALADLIPTWVEGQLVPYDKIGAHLAGLRHKAVSVFVLESDRMLLQRRAAGKYHSAGLWANSCCTHPHWDEPAAACALRRLREELGIEGLEPVFVGQVEYRADVGSRMTEHEVVEIFTARAGPDLCIAPDPAEVSATRWVTLPELLADIAARPQDYTPWLKIYLAEHRATIFGTQGGTRP